MGTAGDGDSSASPIFAAWPGPALECRRVDTALRAGAMRPPLLRAFGLSEGTPCHVVDAKYEAGSSCVVLYQLGEHLATGVLSFDDAGHPDDGGVRVHPGMRAFLFPDDPKLPGLRAAMDPREVTRVLGEGGRSRTRLTLLRYRPGKRATIRIDVRRDRGAWGLIGKVYSDQRKAAAVYEEALALTRALEHAGRVCVARPEGLVAELGMVVWQRVAGAELEPHLDTARGVAHVRAAAEALAAVHALPPVSARTRPVTAELERFHRRAMNVARVAPAAGRRLTELATALVERATQVDHAPAGLVHGDCKPSQFRIDGSQLALLDFDHCGLADPASDVGTFLASLRQRTRGALEAPFFETYASRVHAGSALRDAVAWYESVALLRKALRAFARAPRSPVPALLAREGLRGLEPSPEATGPSVHAATAAGRPG